MPSRSWVAFVVLLLGAQFSLVQMGALAAPVSSSISDARDWNLVLGDVEGYVRGTDHNENITQGKRFLVKRVRAKAFASRAAAQEKLRSTQRILDTLGPPPGKDQPPEPKEIAEKRRLYSRDVSVFRARVAEADLTIVKAAELEAALSSLVRAELFKLLLEPYPSLLSPYVIARGVPDFFDAAKNLFFSPAEWYGAFSKKEGGRLFVWPSVLALLFLVAAGWGIRQKALIRFGRDPAVQSPSYSRRLIAAATEGLSRAFIPAGIIGVFFLWFNRPDVLVGGPFPHLVRSGLGILFVATLVVIFTKAVLESDPPGWRLTELIPENASRVGRLITILVVVFGADLLFRASEKDLNPSDELISLLATLFVILEASLITALARSDLWAIPREGETEIEASPTDENEFARLSFRYWHLLRWGASGASFAGVAAMVAGYPVLGRWIILNLLVSGLIFGFLALVRGLVHDLADLLPQFQIVQERLPIESQTLRAFQSWGRLLVDPMVILVGAALALPLWGVPPDDLFRWGRQILTGFWIGKIQISIIDIALAIAVFLGAMAGTRFVQRSLIERVLKRAQLAPSVRHSLSAGAGYLGVILAVILSVAVTGIDLTNFALVAGALSVGIGFGLQNIVNNFVSGFILLIERPIKVGDWVIVGEKEGFVKRVSFRATELETWQRASVIIPNAEILSSAVTNLTLRDNFGRIEIKVGVAYGSDTAKVRSILLDVSHQHSKVGGDPKPKALFTEFGDSSLNFELRCFTQAVIDRFDVASELRLEIDRRFREEGVHIPFPQRVLHRAPEPGKKPPEISEDDGLI